MITAVAPGFQYSIMIMKAGVGEIFVFIIIVKMIIMQIPPQPLSLVYIDGVAWTPCQPTQKLYPRIKG